MPNWCNNNVTFTHEDAAQIQRLVKAYNEDRLFKEFLPVPEELAQTTSPNDKNPDEMIEKYGAADWYSWSVENWGTKWDVESVDAAEADGNSVSVYFDSAWAPPIAFYQHMETLGFTVDAFYYEPGMAFCGRYSEGEDAEFMIPDTAAEAEREIPKEIDEVFNIVENMSMWEEESKDDV
jgi:hypothetical protein